MYVLAHFTPTYHYANTRTHRHKHTQFHMIVYMCAHINICWHVTGSVRRVNQPSKTQPNLTLSNFT